MTDHRRLDIQGLRAIAVLVVVAFHAGLPVPGGFIGVDVFFVISGFVITAMLQREWLATGRIRFRAFYARRFKRLTPALALMVSVTLVLSVLLLSPLGQQQTTAATGLGAMLIVANLVIARTTGGYFDAAAESNPLLNTWSLSVEEQFYLVFPLILAAGWLLARRRGRWWPVLLATLVTLASLALALATSRGGSLPLLPADLLGFYGPLSRAWEFGAGAILALAMARSPATSGSDLRPRVRGRMAASILGLLLVVASLWLLSAQTPGPGVRNLIPVVGTVLLLWGGAAAGNPVNRLLAARPMIALGDLSYSWYLWHWPVIVLALSVWGALPGLAMVAALVSLLPAVASYRFVEQPIRLRSVAGAREWVRLIGVVVIPPTVLAVAVLGVCGQGYWSETVRAYQAARAPHADTAADCVDVPADADLPPDHCVWNADAPGRPIWLLGDSNAGQFSEAVIEAGRVLGRPVHIYAVHGCPFLDVSGFSAGQDTGDCARYVDRTLTWLSTQPEATVLLAGSSTPWTPPDRAAAGTQESGGPGPDADYLAASITTSVDRLTAGGHEVALLQLLPHFSRDPHRLNYERCSTWSIIAGGCTQRMPRAFADAMQADMLAGFALAAARTGVPLIDLRDRLCPQGTCTTELDGQPVYLDGGHISVGLSTALAGDVLEHLEAR